jgi:hypothetical protein
MAETATIITWALGAAGTTAAVVVGAMSALWSSEKTAQKELVESLKRQALSSETRAIAADQARDVAEKHAGELGLKYGFIKQQLQRAVRALEAAQIRVDPGALVGTISSPPGTEEPTGVWTIEADRRSSYFLAEQEEAERRRQRPLNPETERIDRLSREYLDDPLLRRR